MAEALYRKYRPTSLDEVVGQDHITTTLRNALKKGQVSHAYLFTGPKGLGKTSVARIMAFSVNELAYGKIDQQLDIIEIDAASNRRIDEIRDLRDKVKLMPSAAKYKVYIIDEVHMLTKEAFNALLKTLEEPPAHVIFILATTEAYKLPDTIISRTQRFNFKPVSRDQVVKHLSHIAKQEKIKVNVPALELIASYGEGSFRDSISLLDQLSNQASEIDEKIVKQSLGLSDVNEVSELLAAVLDGDTTAVLDYFNSLISHGNRINELIKQLTTEVRAKLLAASDQIDQSNLVKLMKELVNVPAAMQPDTMLEAVLIETSLKFRVAEPQKSQRLVSDPEPLTTRSLETDVVIKESVEKPKIKQKVVLFDDTIWVELLNNLKRTHNTLYSVLRMAEPRLNNDRLELAFTFKFHQQRIDDSKNKAIISGLLTDLTNKNYEIRTVLDKDAKPFVVKEAKLSADIDTINNIFGETEVVES